MMSIIVSSDSIHKGRHHVERIMDAWLKRVSSTVWAGYLSREGVQKIVDELNDCGRGAKNTMAVSIIWAHNHQFEQITFVGNRKRLENGIAALGKSKRSSKRKGIPDFVRSLMLCTRLAGKSHDLGKATDYYQSLFRGEKSEKGVRHERISAHILSNFYQLGEQKERWITICDLDIPVQKPWQAACLMAVATHHGKREENFNGTGERVSLITSPKDINKRLYDEILSLSKRISEKDLSDRAFPLALFSSRMSLMLGDYAQSSFETSLAYKEEGAWDKKPDNQTIYAKSNPLVPLRSHLDNVATRAENIAKNLFLHQWPALLLYEKPDLMKRMPKGRFAWQHKAEYLIRGMRLGEHDAAFVVLAAETGAGKTLGGYRIMSALRNDTPRFNLAVGYGALAVQTEAEYRNMLGLHHDQVALVVGKRFQKKKDDSHQYDKQEKNYEETEIEVLYGRDANIPESLKSALTNKMRRIISTPIITTTIDHLVSVAAMNKGDDIPSALRLATSDMFIDEIDSFDAKGLHVIARLAYICGMYGRHFVISSATVTPEIVKLLHDAWHGGFNVYRNVFGGKAHLALLTNVESKQGNLSAIFEGDDINPLIEKMAEAGEAISKRAEKSPRFIELLSLDKEGEEQVYQRLLDACMRMSQRHGQDNLSGGFIMFNTASAAQKFTLWLEAYIRQHPEQNIKISCYTNRLSRKNRQKMERFLGALYNRKEDAWKQTDHYQRLTHNDTEKCTHIVATTSIMGVGRDYDFDWCVLEPSTEKALIQAAGRVQRHRLIRPEKPNVALMSNTLYVLTNKKSGEDYEKLFNTKGASPIFKNPLDETKGIPAFAKKILGELETATDGLAIERHERGITSGFRLGKAISPIDKLDRQYVRFVYDEHRGKYSKRWERSSKSIYAFVKNTQRADIKNPFVSTKFDEIQLRDADRSIDIRLDQTELNIHIIEPAFDSVEIYAFPLKLESADELSIFAGASKITYTPNLGVIYTNESL